jgi:hypothetical protein
MGKEYIAARAVDIGSNEVDEDRSTDDHQVMKVHHYEPGEVVKGADGFGNLKALVDNGYLAEKTKDSVKAAKAGADTTEDKVAELGPAATEVERSAARAEAAGAKPPKEIEEAPAVESPATEKPPKAKKTTARKTTTRKTSGRKSPRT